MAHNPFHKILFTKELVLRSTSKEVSRRTTVILIPASARATWILNQTHISVKTCPKRSWRWWECRAKGYPYRIIQLLMLLNWIILFRKWIRTSRRSVRNVERRRRYVRCDRYRTSMAHGGLEASIQFIKCIRALRRWLTSTIIWCEQRITNHWRDSSKNRLMLNRDHLPLKDTWASFNNKEKFSDSEIKVFLAEETPRLKYSSNQAAVVAPPSNSIISFCVLKVKC